MHTHKDMIRTTRRHLLGAGAAMLSGLLMPTSALAQNLQRSRTPIWAQWTRIIGPAAGMRGATTLRVYPYENRMVVARWTTTPPSIQSITEYPDVGGVFASQLFRLYEGRATEELARNPVFIEDFCWPHRTRLRENLWTTEDPATSTLWGELAVREDGVAYPMEKSRGTYILLQPTTDPAPEKGFDLDFLGEHADLPIATVVNAMIAGRMFVAAFGQSRRQALPDAAFSKEKPLLARVVPQAEATFPNVYIRMFSQPS